MTQTLDSTVVAGLDPATSGRHGVERQRQRTSLSVTRGLDPRVHGCSGQRPLDARIESKQDNSGNHRSTAVHQYPTMASRPCSLLSPAGLTRGSIGCSGQAQCRPVNLSFTIGLYGVPARWSMRSWEPGRPGANRRQGFPRSHGPSEGRVDGKRVNLRLMSRCAGFLPDVAAALASGAITATPDRTAVGQARA